MTAPADISSASHKDAGSTARKIDGRLFVIGCARSGTTLLQSFLAAHPAMLAFPESAVFSSLLDPRAVRAVVGRRRDQDPDAREAEQRRAEVADRVQVAQRRTTALLTSLHRPELKARVPGLDSSIEQFGKGFVALIDDVAMARGKTWWLEKTPGYIGIVPQIRQLVPGARFINILRDGRQNVASLHEMALRYPKLAWSARYRDLDTAIERWNICLRRTRALLDASDVATIRYEQLLSATEATLRTLCAFAGLDFSREMIERRAAAASAVVPQAEPWKADVLKAVRAEPENKFERLFDAGQQAYIESRLEPIDFQATAADKSHDR